jgi:VCBS repeat-containing protein
MRLRTGTLRQRTTGRKLFAERLEDRALLAVLFEHGMSDAVRVLVPTQEEYGDLGFDWTGVAEPFDDSAWTEVSGAPNGVGYDRGSGAYDSAIGLDVEASMYEQSTTLFARAEFAVENADAVGRLSLRLRYDDAFIAWINGVEVARANTTGGYPAWDGRAISEYESPLTPVEFDVSDQVSLLRDGANVLAIRLLNDSPTGDDALVAFTLTGESREGPPLAFDDAAETLEGQPVSIDVLANDRDGSDPINPSTVTIATPPAHGTAVVNGDGTITYTPNAVYNGPDTFTYTVRDSSGTGQTTQQTLVASDAPVRVLVPQDDHLGETWRGDNEPFGDSSWTLGNFGVGYDDNPSGTDFWPLINLSVRAQMLNENTSVYMRSEFYVADPQDVVGLTLRMRYDDGFAAFVNGVRVAGNFEPVTLTYDSAAPNANRTDSASATFQDFDITSFREALLPGRNILAIHGLNISLLSSDLLMQPELVAAVADVGVESSPGTVTVNVTGVDYPPIARNDAYAVNEGETLDVAERLDPDDDIILGAGQYLWSTQVGGNGNVYERVVQPIATWTQARAAAAAKSFLGVSGHLATITSPAEQQFLATVMPSDGAWIGAYQNTTAPDYSEPSGGWRWVTGEPWGYTNWRTSEPSNSGAEHHIAAESHVWNDIREDYDWNAFWVEYPLSNIATRQEVLVDEGEVWRYWDKGNIPPADSQNRNWKQPAFDDVAWGLGPAQLGYGDGDEVTTIDCGPARPTCTSSNFITTWFRRSFTIAPGEASLYSVLAIELLRDDGGSVYINGVEVLRDNLPGTLGDNALTANTTSAVSVAGNDENVFQLPEILALTSAAWQGLLRDGENVVAVEIHQVNDTSSDVGFDLKMTATREASPPLLANDVEPDGQAMTVILESPPTNGTLDLGSDGTFTYMPNVAFSGVDTFTYRATDGTLTSELATVTINVNHAAPIATPDNYTTDESAPLIVTAALGLLANDVDTQDHALAASVATLPQHGSLSLNADGSFIYTPTPGYDGTDSFTYVASDGVRSSNPVTVSIALNAIDSPPVAADDVFQVIEGYTLGEALNATIKNINTGFNDISGGKYADGAQDTDYVIGAGSPFSVGAPPRVSRTGNPSSWIADGASANSTWVGVGTGDVPSGVYFFDTTVNVPGGDASGVVLAGIRYAADNQLVSIFVNNTRVYAVPVSDPEQFLDWIPLENQGRNAFIVGENRIRFGVYNLGPGSNPFGFRLQAGVVFDPAARANVLANDFDPDSINLVASVIAQPTHGDLTLNANGSFRYTPNAGFSGVDQFTYRVSDGQQFSQPATVRIVVAPASKAPQDLNADGNIDAGDVAFLLASFGRTSNAKAIEGDLDGDGRIGVRDVIALRNAIAPPPSPAPAAALVARTSDQPRATAEGPLHLRHVERRVRASVSPTPEIAATATDRALAEVDDARSALTNRRSRSIGRSRR